MTTKEQEEKTTIEKVEVKLDEPVQVKFSDLNLIAPLIKSVEALGYETPSPIQAQTIPLLLDGKDVIGQAQTGTGKTGAFALPLLSNIDLSQKNPQVLVLAPTRELAIQVAEAFQTYARHLKGFNVLPIYGGQSYEIQLRQLKRGVHVVVGTPGRVMDHMRRKTLNLSNLKTLVLDEADEMLRMGFIDDVKWVLEQLPKQRQIALFSATMPQVIRKIAQQHLTNPIHVSIQMKETTAETIRQRYWMVSGRNKVDALTRVLEAEAFDAVIIFVRTKTATEELAEKLSARGYSATALNGDIAQKTRENTVNRLKQGKIDILVATDVAARGLDVQRISHVINYDIPQDTESYVHRIGRTGRAGREGDAILFVAPREKRLLYAIEKATKKSIEKFEMPTTESINDKRIEEFKDRITETLESGEGLTLYTEIVEQYRKEHDVPANEIAAALAKLAQGDKALLLKDEPQRRDRSERPQRAERNPRFDAPEDKRRSSREASRNQYEDEDIKPRRESTRGPKLEQGMERFRLDVGEVHGVKPGNIVGAIANEIGLESEFIGRVQILDDYSIVDLPDGMPKAIFNELKNIQVCGQRLNASLLDSAATPQRAPHKQFKPGRGSDGDRRPSRGGKHGGRGRSDNAGGRKPPRRNKK
ncbi:DEAD/DEAH box helicase [Mariprofundus sp. EBB-1]|uniref:DEAD/DEAH box helicase n=1 Tax=Mariprofundus sp. EBB-1 TaxID=2650971 RepID=UPI000EF27949|nr:DEAD/DEAH box helicase [Mariprofundus sp. EBB-1]RLL51870.1 DEAD/DEAH box helicase [Mariprofundus sp. EBB-1]